MGEQEKGAWGRGGGAALLAAAAAALARREDAGSSGAGPGVGAGVCWKEEPLCDLAGLGTFCYFVA